MSLETSKISSGKVSSVHKHHAK